MRLLAELQIVTGFSGGSNIAVNVRDKTPARGPGVVGWCGRRRRAGPSESVTQKTTRDFNTGLGIVPATTIYAQRQRCPSLWTAERASS